MRKISDNTVFVLKTLLILTAITTITLLLMRFIVSRSQVDGMSMYPTLWDDEHVFVNKICYNNKNPERYDIIIFQSPLSERGYYIKRVIGLPHETVQIDKNGTVYIDDNIIDDTYGFETIKDPGRAAEPIVLGEDEFFVLGDNRNHSEDSRFSAGNVRKKDILGRVRIRVLPLNKYGYIDLYRSKTMEK